jgi:hypothetical protein
MNYLHEEKRLRCLLFANANADAKKKKIKKKTNSIEDKKLKKKLVCSSLI